MRDEVQLSPWKAPMLTGTGSWNGAECGWTKIVVCPGCLYVLSNGHKTSIGEQPTALSKGWTIEGSYVNYCSRCGKGADYWQLEWTKPKHTTRTWRRWKETTVLVLVARYLRPTVRWYNPLTWFHGGHWEVREADWPAVQEVMENRTRE